MSGRSAFLFIFVFALAFLIRVNHSANVLCMFTSSAKSQLVVFMAVANSLIERGHNVTVVTTIPIPMQSVGRMPYRHVLLQQHNETMQTLNDSLATVMDENISKIKAMSMFINAFNSFISIQTNALQQKKFKDFFKEDNHFDLMLLGYFNNDFLVGVAARYRCPIAVISLGSPYGPISRMVGNPEETSYVQFPLFGRSQPMSFRERLVNFFWAAVEPCLHAYVNWIMENIYKTLFTDDFFPEYSDVITNISLVLCNNHFSELPIRPLVPALIEIGGIQIKEQPGRLPEDIQDFLDSSTNGTILYILGSKTRGSFLKIEKLQIILNVFSKLDQNILCEWDRTEESPKIYPNILFKRYLPHEDILFHRNLKLFITDGRSNTIFGAQRHGIPMLGIPLSGDEHYNVGEMVNKGFGLSVDINTFTEDTLTEAISNVLENPYFAQKVKQFSSIYSDRPITAKETAVFWLEYVIRHHGARHMQSPLVHMDFVQSWNIDVILVVFVGFNIFRKLPSLIAILVRKCLESRAKRTARYRKYKQL